MKPSLSVISFMNSAFSVVSRKISPYPRSSRFSALLLSRSFIVGSLYPGQSPIVS